MRHCSGILCCLKIAPNCFPMRPKLHPIYTQNSSKIAHKNHHFRYQIWNKFDSFRIIVGAIPTQNASKIDRKFAQKGSQKGTKTAPKWRKKKAKKEQKKSKKGAKNEKKHHPVIFGALQIELRKSKKGSKVSKVQNPTPIGRGNNLVTRSLRNNLVTRSRRNKIFQFRVNFGTISGANLGQIWCHSDRFLVPFRPISGTIPIYF